jgi:hypothetical protein
MSIVVDPPRLRVQVGEATGIRLMWCRVSSPASALPGPVGVLRDSGPVYSYAPTGSGVFDRQFGWAKPLRLARRMPNDGFLSVHWSERPSAVFGPGGTMHP